MISAAVVPLLSIFNHSRFVAGTQIHLESGYTKLIDQMTIGQRGVTRPKGIVESLNVQPDHNWKLIRLILNDQSKDCSEIELLRSPDWIESHQAQVGGSIFLNMPEMIVEAMADVLAIEPCPVLEEGVGNDSLPVLSSTRRAKSMTSSSKARSSPSALRPRIRSGQWIAMRVLSLWLVGQSRLSFPISSLIVKTL